MKNINIKVGSTADLPVAKSEIKPEKSIAGKVWESLNQFLKPENIIQGTSKNIAPKDLLLLQIKASSYHLRVELVSKAAESLLATVRKFQNG